MTLRRAVGTLVALAAACLVVSILLQAGGDHFDERFQATDGRGRASLIFLQAAIILPVVALGLWIVGGIVAATRRSRDAP